MPTTDPQILGRRHVGAAVKAERLRLGWGKEQAAREAGISSITWSRIEDGLTVQDAKLSKAWAAVGLAAGSLVSVMIGGEPSRVDDVQPVGLGLDAEADGLPTEDVEAIRAQVRALKRARGLG